MTYKIGLNFLPLSQLAFEFLPMRIKFNEYWITLNRMTQTFDRRYDQYENYALIRKVCHFSTFSLLSLCVSCFFSSLGLFCFPERLSANEFFLAWAPLPPLHTSSYIHNITCNVVHSIKFIVAVWVQFTMGEKVQWVRHELLIASRMSSNCHYAWCSQRWVQK